MTEMNTNVMVEEEETVYVVYNGMIMSYDEYREMIEAERS